MCAWACLPGTGIRLAFEARGQEGLGERRREHGGNSQGLGAVFWPGRHERWGCSRWKQWALFVALAAESQEGLQQGARKEGGDAVPAGGSSETWLTFMLWVSLLLELGCRSSRFAKRVGAKALSALPSVLGCGAEARHQWLGVSADDPLAKRRRGSIWRCSCWWEGTELLAWSCRKVRGSTSHWWVASCSGLCKKWGRRWHEVQACGGS